MSVAKICQDIGSLLAEASQLEIQQNKYSYISANKIQLEKIYRMEEELNQKVYRLSGFPAYQLCEYSYLNVSLK
jgi:hypothetical protein